MKISTFFYILRQGFANIRRNILFSLASIGTIISCLFLFGIIYAVVVNFQSGMQELESTVTISVFFDEDTSDETIHLIGEQIRTLDYVNTMDLYRQIRRGITSLSRIMTIHRLQRMHLEMTIRLRMQRHTR